MGATFRASSTNTVTGIDRITVSIPAGAQLGDALVLAVSYDNGAATATPPSGWTEEVDTGHPNGFGHIAAFSRVYQSGDGNPEVILSASTNIAGAIIAVATAHSTAPVDIDGIATGTSSLDGNIDCPSVTTNFANGLLICAYTTDAGNRTYTPPSGMTERIDLNQGSATSLGIATQELGAAGATGAKTAVCSATNIDWIGYTIAIRVGVVANTLTASADGIIQAARTATANADAAIAATLIASVSEDGAVQAAMSAQTFFDGKITTPNATMKIREKNGAGETATDKTGAVIVHKTVDDAVDDSTNPVVRPAAGQRYSMQKLLRLEVDGNFNSVLNLKAYTDGANGLGTGVNLWWATATSYTQPATPSEADDPPEYNSVDMTNAFLYTSVAPLSLSSVIYDSTNTPKDIGDYLVSVLEVESLASAGITPTETITFAWDEV